MDHLFFKKTRTTPRIDFKSTGHMIIKGSLLPEDPKVFFTSIFKWVENMNTKVIMLDIKLNYINTSSSKRIIELIKSIDRKTEIKKIDMKWHYEADDSDMLEFGELIQRNLKRTKIQYIECEDIDE